MIGHALRGKRCTSVYLVILMLFLFPSGLHAGETGPELRGPVADSVLRQQRDSILLSLHLQYLNGVNDRHTPYEQISIIEEILGLDPTQYNHWFNLGLENIRIHEYEKALEALNRGLDLYPVEENPTLVQIYICLSFCYHRTGKHRKEKEVLDFASEMHPNHPEIIGRYAIRAHSRMRFTEAEHHEQNLIAILRSSGQNESDIAYYLGRLYLNEDYLKAEKHLRTALRYDPENTEKMGALAWVIIRNALKIEEGMAFIEKAIEADPGNAMLLHQQGYGFYMQGNYNAALFNLYTARELYQQFNFEINNHIEMVEDALATLARE